MNYLYLDTYIQRVTERKRQLNIVDTEENIEQMRNRGYNRTPEKRELLRSIKERCLVAGIEPYKCYIGDEDVID